MPTTAQDTNNSTDTNNYTSKDKRFDVQRSRKNVRKFILYKHPHAGPDSSPTTILPWQGRAAKQVRVSITVYNFGVSTIIVIALISPTH